MLWTRIDPDAYKKNKKLAFEVARDADFNDVVARGRVKGKDITPENDYTVKLDLDGKLPRKYAPLLPLRLSKNRQSGRTMPHRASEG